MDIITFPMLLRWIGALLLTLCLMLLAAYLMQNGKTSLQNRNPARRMKKKENLFLTRTSQAHLVEIDGQELVIVTTPQTSTIHPLPTSQFPPSTSKKRT